MLTDMCISELEDVARDPSCGGTPGASVIQESPHPLSGITTLTRCVRIPGAEGLRVEFDTRCSTEKKDNLMFSDPIGSTTATYSGREPTDWSQEFQLTGDELRWEFKSSGSSSTWGFKFIVHPILPPKVSSCTVLSDRVLQSRPSIDLVTCLLGFQLSTTTHSQEAIPRLGAALAACAQLQTLDASQRMWSIQQLQRLISSPMGTCLYPIMSSMTKGDRVSVSTSNSLQTLVQRLPDMLAKQYNYELPHVSSGTQLLHRLVLYCLYTHTHTHTRTRTHTRTHAHKHTHTRTHVRSDYIAFPCSPFFQSLMTLAANLELDTLDCCSDTSKWSWFSQYCMALRTAKSLQHRTPLPIQFVQEVSEKITVLKQDGESDDASYLDHRILKQEHDEQLLLWIQRYVLLTDHNRKFSVTNSLHCLLYM